MEMATAEVTNQAERIDDGSCFVCHGTGHWARECTSLPAVYLTNDAPRCYRCNGVGHFARFCPTSVKQFKFRQRRHSIPHVDLSSWDNYYSEIFPYPILHDQVFLIRPEYDSSADYGNCIDDIMSDCSPVNYIISDQDTTKDDHLSEESAPCHSPFNEFGEKQVVEVSIETISNK